MVPPGPSAAAEAPEGSSSQGPPGDHLPPSRECPGLVVLVGDDVYLACQFHEDVGLWQTAYLDVATGEIVFQVDAAKGCVSRQWSLEARA